MKEIILSCKCHKIDNNGNVYSKLEQYSEKGKRGIQTRVGEKWKKLNMSLGKSGYYQISLHGRIVRINRLMAVNFLKNDFAYPEVHHINGTKTDNRVENLKWGNQKQNAEDRKTHGNNIYGSKSPNAKLNEKKIKNIRSLLKLKFSLNNIAEQYKVSKKLILLIKQKKIWKHVK